MDYHRSADWRLNNTASENLPRVFLSCVFLMGLFKFKKKKKEIEKKYLKAASKLYDLKHLGGKQLKY